MVSNMYPDMNSMQLSPQPLFPFYQLIHWAQRRYYTTYSFRNTVFFYLMYFDQQSDPAHFFQIHEKPKMGPNHSHFKGSIFWHWQSIIYM